MYFRGKNKYFREILAGGGVIFPLIGLGLKSDLGLGRTLTLSARIFRNINCENSFPPSEKEKQKILLLLKWKGCSKLLGKGKSKFASGIKKNNNWKFEKMS